MSWALSLIPPLTSHEVVPFDACPKCAVPAYHLMAEQRILRQRQNLSGYYHGMTHAGRQGFTNPNTHSVESNVYRSLNAGAHVVVLVRECMECRARWSEWLADLNYDYTRYQNEMRQRSLRDVRVAN